ncbi:hypothetical protein [Mesorhizobium sp. M0684]|uniref:hypothetical protein n=1 Tax=unclassified Mesorhizobium TaxID=325217 RepID=UPI00333DA3A4
MQDQEPPRAPKPQDRSTSPRKSRRAGIDSSAAEGDAALHNLGAAEAMAVRIRMPGGTLKVKVYRELRDRERSRRIPVVKIGRIYFTWWSNRQRLVDDQSPG